ncbi:ribosomal protein S5 domain 2-like protein [Gloeopeniophorella convolvens]|nr:ribosomal protein S5 domain 2-like protein [Gloeopeniophorella convolvens]
MAFRSLSKSEKAYIQASLQAKSPLRGDGRAPHEFRTVVLETGAVALANGSARVNIGRAADESTGGTEVLAAAKLEVEDIGAGKDGVDGGRIACTVSCSPAAYPHLANAALDDLQHDYTAIVHDVLAHASLRPPGLGIVPGRKAWLLTLDLMVLSDAGGVYDALFVAARAALWDTRVPKTRAVEYRPGRGSRGEGDMDVDAETQSGLDTRQLTDVAADFELEDYWDEGPVLGGRDMWPVSITLNLFPGVHFLDATSQEEAATPLRLLLVYSFAAKSAPALQGMHLLGTGDIDLTRIKSLVKDGEKYALEMYTALNTKLKDEDIRRTNKAQQKFSASR